MMLTDDINKDNDDVNDDVQNNYDFKDDDIKHDAVIKGDDVNDSDNENVMDEMQRMTMLRIMIFMVMKVTDVVISLQAVDLAIEDSSDRVMDIIVRLLRFLTDAAVVTADQFEKVPYPLRLSINFLRYPTIRHESKVLSSFP